MSCTIASSDEPSVTTWVSRSSCFSTPRISASLARGPAAGYLACSAAIAAVKSLVGTLAVALPSAAAMASSVAPTSPSTAMSQG